MLYSFATLNKIPPDSFVVRIKGTGRYIHFHNEEMYLEDRMVGCFVCCEDTAIDMLIKLKSIEYEYDLEYIKFSVAYKEHGLIERQVQYN